jgi:hypothetical protein
MVTNSKCVWTRQETLGIAAHDCIRCHGLGLQAGQVASAQPCPCVLRAIFRICYEHFHRTATKDRRLTSVAADRSNGRVVWGRPDEEYMADFLAIAKRTLSEEQHRVFRMHFLLGANWRACCARLGIDKGFFFHLITHIERLLGRALRETLPHALYPIDEYLRATNAKR